MYNLFVPESALTLSDWSHLRNDLYCVKWDVKLLYYTIWLVVRKNTQAVEYPALSIGYPLYACRCLVLMTCSGGSCK